MKDIELSKFSTIGIDESAWLDTLMSIQFHLRELYKQQDEIKNILQSLRQGQGSADSAMLQLAINDLSDKFSPDKAVQEVENLMDSEEYTARRLMKLLAGTQHSFGNGSKYTVRCEDTVRRCARKDIEALEEAWPVIASIVGSYTPHSSLVKGMFRLFQRGRKQVYVNEVAGKDFTLLSPRVYDSLKRLSLVEVMDRLGRIESEKCNADQFQDKLADAIVDVYNAHAKGHDRILV